MLNMIGTRLHPAVAILLGLALVAAGIATDALVLSVVGAVVTVAIAWRAVDAHRHHEHQE